MVEVSQRAREAWIEHEDLPKAWADACREGAYDNAAGLQVFAKFEADILTSIEKVKEERDRLREVARMLRPSTLNLNGRKVSIEFPGGPTAGKFYFELIAALDAKEGE